MAISSKNCQVEQKNYSLLANWSDWALIFQHLLRIEADLSVHLTLSSTTPCGRPSASLEYLDSLILPHYHSASLPAAVQNTTPEGVSFKCWCPLTLTLTTSIGIWHSAGVTKGVTSSAAHRGIWHGVGVMQSWLHSATLTKFFAVIEKVSTQPKFSIWMMRETLRDDNQIPICTKISWWVKWYVVVTREC